MTRIPALDPAAAHDNARESLAAVEKMLGGVPNLFRVTANSPAALAAMVSLFGTTGRDSLGAKTRAAIALVVAEVNGCDYCLSAHTVLGTKAGMSPGDLAAARDAGARDEKTAALLRFARDVMLQRGRAGERALAAVRAAGASDAEILEVVANVVLNFFTNAVNLIADTDIDFPVVRSGTRS